METVHLSETELHVVLTPRPIQILYNHTGHVADCGKSSMWSSHHAEIPGSRDRKCRMCSNPVWQELENAGIPGPEDGHVENVEIPLDVVEVQYLDDMPAAGK